MVVSAGRISEILDRRGAALPLRAAGGRAGPRRHPRIRERPPAPDRGPPDPLVHPRRPATGRAIFSWAVPVHAHTGRRRRALGHAGLRRGGHPRRHDDRRGRNGGPPRARRRRHGRGRDAGHGRDVGLGRRGRPVRGAGRRGDRAPARRPRPVPSRRPGHGLGDAGRPRPHVGRARAGRQRAGPRPRHPPHVPPLPFGLRPAESYLARTGRRPLVHLQQLARWDRTCWWPTPSTSTTPRSRCCCVPAPRWRPARGPTCASVKG